MIVFQHSSSSNVRKRRQNWVAIGAAGDESVQASVQATDTARAAEIASLRFKPLEATLPNATKH
jgi:hypothetical protein